jgi:hypothetical protein
MNSLKSILTLLLFLTPWGSIQLASAGTSHSHEKKPKVILGTITTQSLTLSVSTWGPLTPGKTADAEITVEPAEPAPAAVRVWVGVESAKGSAKNKTHLDEPKAGIYHGEPVVPETLPTDSQLWVEVQLKNNQRIRVPFPIKN